MAWAALLKALPAIASVASSLGGSGGGGSGGGQSGGGMMPLNIKQNVPSLAGMFADPNRRGGIGNPFSRTPSTRLLEQLPTMNMVENPPIMSLVDKLIRR